MYTPFGRAIQPPTVWLEFQRYLAHPHPLTPSGLMAPGARTIWLAMVLLQAIGTVILVLAVDGWRRIAGFAGPHVLERYHGVVMVLIPIVLIPIVEESLFRGWLTGRPRALWLLAVTALALVALMLVEKHHPLAMNWMLGAALLAGLAGWLVLRRRGGSVIAFCFAPTFYASALLFAGMHIFNYHASWWLVAPMVLPQLWYGLVAGFIRLRIGLPAAMLLHAVNNGAALLLLLWTRG